MVDEELCPLKLQEKHGVQSEIGQRQSGRVAPDREKRFNISRVCESKWNCLWVWLDFIHTGRQSMLVTLSIMAAEFSVVS